jgi:hypothetical protein
VSLRAEVARVRVALRAKPVGNIPVVSNIEIRVHHGADPTGADPEGFDTGVGLALSGQAVEFELLLPTNSPVLLIARSNHAMVYDNVWQGRPLGEVRFTPGLDSDHVSLVIERNAEAK